MKLVTISPVFRLILLILIVKLSALTGIWVQNLSFENFPVNASTPYIQVMEKSDLPKNKTNWTLQARKLGVHKTSMKDLEHTASASKMGEKQYLALRVLWPETQELDANRYINKQSMKWAENQLLGDKTWQNYLNALQAGVNMNRVHLYTSAYAEQLGRFEWAYRTQDRVLRPNGVSKQEAQAQVNFRDTKLKIVPWSEFSLPSVLSIPPNSPESPLASKGASSKFVGEMLEALPKTPFNQIGKISEDSRVAPSPITGETFNDTYSESRLKAIQDEVIVENALLTFLQCLMNGHLRLNAGSMVPEWSPIHVRLKCTDWVAITDGSLRSADGQVQALVEVKAMLREDALDKIRKQESGQMVAWIYANPEDDFWTLSKTDRKNWWICEDGNYHNANAYDRRAMVSQDRHQIWLTFAEYDQNYVEYLRDGKMTDKPSFLTMHEYGPWEVGKKQQVNEIGRIMLAFAHQQLVKPKEFDNKEAFEARDIPQASSSSNKGKGKA